MRGLQLFATPWLGLGLAKTPITADKRLRYAPPKFLASLGTSYMLGSMKRILSIRSSYETRRFNLPNQGTELEQKCLKTLCEISVIRRWS